MSMTKYAINSTLDLNSPMINLILPLNTLISNRIGSKSSLRMLPICYLSYN